MIAVTFALPQESQDFVRKLAGRRILAESHLPILAGQIGAREITICHTGVGVEAARQNVRHFLKAHRPRMLISTGFAGGLDPRLQVADLVVATNFSAPDLLDAARHLCARTGGCYFGTFTTQTEVAATSESKLELARSGASAVDMETSAIFEACRDFTVPMLVARSISDRATEALPVPFEVWFDNVKQQPRVLALLRHLARHPRQLPPFCRFVKGIRRARARLTDYLLELIPKL